MKVKITAVETFDVHVGEHMIGQFKCAGDWNGMMELVNEAGHKLIIERPNAMASIFADLLNQPQEVLVVKASPPVLEKMIQESGAGAS